MHSLARPAALLASLLMAGGAAPSSSSAQIVAAAPASAWQQIPPQDLLVMQFGAGQRAVIQLAPEFAPAHVANIAALAHAGWWSHAHIVRVQDNYVVQWSADDETRKLPQRVAANPPPEYERSTTGLTIHALPYPDSYADGVGYADGWPVGIEGAQAWPIHCYGMVGVGRDLPPDTGSGVELYAVIGQAPRHLDRNIALVGRVLEGMPLLAALPRGTADLGFYAKPAERIAITAIRLAADLPPAQQPRFQMMRVDAPAFATYLDARANRRDSFFVRPAGRVDICNAPVPVRAD